MKSKIEQQREHFNSIAEKYRVGREDVNHKTIKSIIWDRAGSVIKNHLPDDFSMLEAMCGYAEGYGIISDTIGTPCDYLGFDYSDDIVSSKAIIKTGLNVIHADATQFMPENNKYDLILLIGGLHHVPDFASDVVKRLSTGLKHGGIFVNLEPTHANPLYKWIRNRIYKNNEIFDVETERSFELEELKSFFLKAELTESSIQNVGLSAYTLFYNPYAFPLLNKGNPTFVKIMAAIDKLFWTNRIGRFFSFATLSIWKKPMVLRP
jgi:SAM-dependent methyltransferase